PREGRLAIGHGVQASAPDPAILLPPAGLACRLVVAEVPCRYRGTAEADLPDLAVAQLPARVVLDGQLVSGEGAAAADDLEHLRAVRAGLRFLLAVVRGRVDAVG